MLRLRLTYVSKGGPCRPWRQDIWYGAYDTGQLPAKIKLIAEKQSMPTSKHIHSAFSDSANETSFIKFCMFPTTSDFDTNIVGRWVFKISGRKRSSLQTTFVERHATTYMYSTSPRYL